MNVQSQPEKITAAEIRELFAELRAELESLRAELHTFRNGVAAASEKPQTNYRDFVADEIIMGYDDAGKPTYKAKGIPFAKFGVRIWDEVLPILGVDATTLKPGSNKVQIAVRAEMVETVDGEGRVKSNPRKIIGRAVGLPCLA